MGFLDTIKTSMYNKNEFGRLEELRKAINTILLVLNGKKTSDALQSLFAEIEELYVGYKGTGSFNNPSEGASALSIKDAVIALEQYLNGGWSGVNKMSFGILVGTAVLSMIGCRGLIHPDADTSDLTGEELPVNNLRVIDCEDISFNDQYGNAPDIATNLSRTSSWKKFGTYSMGATSGSRGLARWNSVLKEDTDVLIAFWCYIDNGSASTGFIDLSKYEYTKTIYTDGYSGLLNYNADGTITLQFSEYYGTFNVQDVTITSDVIDEGEHYISYGVIWDELKIFLRIDGTLYTKDIDALSFTGAPISSYIQVRPVNGYPTSSWHAYIDDIIFGNQDNFMIDLFVQHYLSGLPWNTTYSYADQIIKAAPGGKIQLASDVAFTGSVNIITGMIAAFAVSTAPSGWLACQGQAVSRTTYAALYAVIGTTWGSGDGSTTFNLPDLRGAFLRGTGSHGSKTMANGNPYAGPAVGSFENDQMQGHYHDAKMRHKVAGYDYAGYVPTHASTNAYSGNWYNANGLSIQAPKTDGTNGTPRTGDETRPFAAGILYCIKT